MMVKWCSVECEVWSLTGEGTFFNFHSARVLNIFFDLGGGGVGTVVVFTSPPCSPCFHWLKVRRI